MRTQLWTAAVALVGFYIDGMRAQTGTSTDLGTLLSGQTNLSTFYGLIQKYPNILLELPSYDGVTILAPDNDAFNKISYTELNTAFKDDDMSVITNVLQYHILSGSRTAAQLIPGSPVFIPTLLMNNSYTNVTGGAVVENVKQAGDVVVFVSGKGSRSTVVKTDLSFNDGYVQVVDSLLIPPANITDTARSFNLTAFEGSLYQAQKTSTYAFTLNLTIFAPNNDAFQALGPAISSMTIEELSSVLDYHVIPKSVIYSPSLTNGTKLLTLQGENITILHFGNNVYINSAQLLTSDILLANGVLHVIDNVLNPQGPGAQPNPQIGSQAPVFASASLISSLPFTTAIPCTSSCPATTSSSSSTSTGTVTSSSTVVSSTTQVESTSSEFNTANSKAFAAMARETGYGAAGFMVAIGGAVLMV